LGLNRFDVEKDRKRLRSVLKTEEGRQAFLEELNLRVVDKENVKRPLVALLVPTHKAPHPRMTGELEKAIRCAKEVADIAPQPFVSTSVVHWTRNELLMRLNKSKLPYTHVLFCDDDIVPPDDSILKMMNHGVDIVAAACTVRQDPPLPNFRAFREEDFTYHTAYEWTRRGVDEDRRRGHWE
jgi:hypothetical protein